MTTRRALDDVVAAARRFRGRLVAMDDQALADIANHYQRIAEACDRHIRRLTADLALIPAGEPIPISWLYERDRLARLRADVTREVTRHIPTLETVAVGHAEAAATLAPQDALTLINRSAGTRFTHRGLDATRAEQIIGQTTSDAIHGLFADLPEHAGLLAARALETGVTLGRNPLVIAADITHALGGNRARAQTIARTEAIRAYREASLATWRQTGVVHRWQWFSTLDRTACPVCVAMHGTIHPISETMGSHPACRCTPVPVPDGTPPPVTTSGVEEFEGWTYGQQRRLLGPGKHDAYLAGELRLPDLVATEHHSRWGLVRRERSLRDVVASAVGRRRTPPPSPPTPGTALGRVHDVLQAEK